MTPNPRKVKVIRGYVVRDYLENGWDKNDIFLFIYRKKQAKHIFVPVTITYSQPKRNK